MIDKKSLTRKLYYSDNLPVLKEFAEESVDLIYLDPPFNSNKAYNIIRPGDLGQVTAFEDTWYWSSDCDSLLREMQHQEARSILNALVGAKGKIQLCAYLVNMAARLIEMKRILKSTGTIYLHCDPTASHYLKIVMDAIFGENNFLNEIIWHYRKWPSGKYPFQRNHDVLLMYGAGGPPESRHFNQLYMERSKSTQKRFGDAKIYSAYDETGKRLPSQTDKDASKGVRQDDVWDINRVAPVKQLFPTQKPLELMKRIVTASSNEGDLVLDPFCGCGTTVAAAESLNRNWIGIDITYSSIAAIQKRFEQEKLNVWGDIQIHGEPKTLHEVESKLINQSAAKARKEFEKWCVTRVGGLPNSTMGADGGIDGRILLPNDEVAIISVKSGKVSIGQIRELKGLLDEKQTIGIFISKDAPTKPMLQFAKQSGSHESKDKIGFPRSVLVPKIQIITLEQILKGELPILP